MPARNRRKGQRHGPFAGSLAVLFCLFRSSGSFSYRSCGIFSSCGCILGCGCCILGRCNYILVRFGFVGVSRRDLFLNQCECNGIAHFAIGKGNALNAINGYDVSLLYGIALDDVLHGLTCFCCSRFFHVGGGICDSFVYDFDRFDAEKILPMFAKYQITTFCAPPTMYRMLIKQDLSRFDLSSIQHASIAGEALNPEVFRQFEKATGMRIMEGFGQSESTLIIGNLAGDSHKIGSMGKPVPLYDVHLLDSSGHEAEAGDTGEICINIQNGIPCGLAYEYYNSPEVTAKTWHDGFYHTGDLAWRDEDGFYWYVGRADDVIKSSGYRIGPFEIENVIMELPYVLECGVSAAPDEIRGQVVKASIVLVKGTEGTDALKKEIQTYVKTHTAPYKYPRIVEFREALPKTTSGKIIRSKL